MIPYILGLAGGYLLGSATKKIFADGGGIGEYYGLKGRINDRYIEDKGLVWNVYVEYPDGEEEIVGQEKTNQYGVKIWTPEFSSKKEAIEFSKNEGIILEFADGGGIGQEKMEDGVKIGQKNIRYFIGKPGIDIVGRFGRKRATWKTCVVDENGNKNYGEYTIQFSGSVNKIILDGMRISQKEFDKLVFGEGGIMKAKGGKIESLKIKHDELDEDGHTLVAYDENKKEWYWEDYKNDTYRTKFKSEVAAYENLIAYLETIQEEIDYRNY